MPLRTILPQFIVNSDTSGQQIESSSTLLADGRIVMLFNNQQTSSSTRLRAQIMETDGSTLVADIPVLTPTVTQQFSNPLAQITSFGDGGFAVAFGIDPDRQVIRDEGVRLRFFSETGQQLGATVNLNAASSHAELVRLVTLENGRVLALWQERDDATFSQTIKARLFNTNGSPFGPTFIVKNESAQIKISSGNGLDVVATEDGGFLVSYYVSNFTTSENSSTVQKFTASGVKSGGETRLTALGEATLYKLTALKDGTVIATWFDSGKLKAQSLTSAGKPDGAVKILLETPSATNPFLVDLEDGRFGLMTGTRNAAVETQMELKLFDYNGNAISQKITLTDLSIKVSRSLVLDQDGNLVLPSSVVDPSTTEFDVAATKFNPRIYDGTVGADFWTGGSKNDSMKGFAGNDKFSGRGGNDKLNGGDGKDTLSGGTGNDILTGGANEDSLLGGDGNDILNGGRHADTLSGGNGIDIASYFDDFAGVHAALDGSITALQQTGEARGDKYISIENLSGSNTGTDRLIGNIGANTLRGNGNADVMFGRGGSDKLVGGLGADRLNGGRGADKFIYELDTEGKDTIVDFDITDTLVFVGENFGNLAEGSLAARHFKSSQAGIATTLDHRFIYNTVTDTLIYDENGSANGGVHFIATFLNNPTLTVDDIQII